MRRLKILKAIAIYGLISAPIFSGAQINSSDEIGEGFDNQSAQEIERARQEIDTLFSDAIKPSSIGNDSKLKILGKYQHLDPKREVPTNLLETAVIFFDQNITKFPNQAYITVIDLKPRSDKYRFYVVDMATGGVEKYHVAHGIGSDKDDDGYAEKFGNLVNSGMSSLGFIRTAEVYSGKFKRSVRLDGLSQSNSKVRERAIVLHGWDNTHEANVIQGLGWGCPALDWSVKDGVIDKVKEGSLMYIGLSST